MNKKTSTIRHYFPSGYFATTIVSANLFVSNEAAILILKVNKVFTNSRKKSFEAGIKYNQSIQNFYSHCILFHTHWYCLQSGHKIENPFACSW